MMSGLETFYLFYYGTPVVIVALAFVVVWLHERAHRKEIEREHHPAE